MRLRLVLVIVAAFTFGAFAAFATIAYRQPSNDAASVIRSAGKALVGGPFSLTNHTGKRVTDADFRGKHMLVYFGFTYCPDVCPTALQVMASALESLGEEGKKITPIFITVDPERDTTAHMASYVTHFHDRLVGLTGSPDEIRAAAKAYRVYYAKVKDETSSAGFTFDHSSIVFLMDANGQYTAHFPHGTSPEKMATVIKRYL